MNTAVASETSAKKQSMVIQYIPHRELIARINGALKEYESSPRLPEDTVGTTLTNIASYFTQARDVDAKPRKHVGIDFNRTMNRAEHELSRLFGTEALRKNPIAAQVHKTFTEALKGSIYDFTR